MPKDKTETHNRLVPIVKDEFLTHGYEKASVNRIAAAAGLSPAGLYRHFAGKEDMFASLVEPALAEFRSMSKEWEAGAIQNAQYYDPFGSAWAEGLLDFIFRNFDALKLLLCCSGGSKYENFEEELVVLEQRSSKKYARALQKTGRKAPAVSNSEWHLMATLYVRAVTEIVRHGMTRKQAEKHLQFVQGLLYPGMKQLFGLGGDAEP